MDRLKGGSWGNWTGLHAREFVCGYCGNTTANDRGCHYSVSGKTAPAELFLCPLCQRPSYFEGSIQNPGVAFGDAVPGLPDDIEILYNEARRCCANSCFTSAVLACRKLLMHLAVSKGAKQGDSFLSYVQHLSDKGYVPPDGKEWVDHIREKGNEANHEIVVMGPEDAEDLISFAEMLLRVIFEFPSRIKAKRTSQLPPSLENGQGS